MTELDIPLVLRPTSETAMYPIFALWVRSHRDLPLNVYQIVNTFRYETKTTRPFVRVREIHFFEEHTCQVDEERATERVRSNLAAFRRMAASYALPYLAVRRPPWDTFPGAHYTIAFDLPLSGARTLQLGSVHHYRDNFSVPYGIRYEAPDGSERPVHQTTFGLSERLLGAIVGAHGDARGVVFPSEVAPTEVVVIPILSAATADKVSAAAQEVTQELRRAGLRVRLDDGDERPGAKFYRWEMLGVPLRLEVGARELDRGELTGVDRLGRKTPVRRAALATDVSAVLSTYDRDLAQRAGEAFRSAIAPAATLAELHGSEKVRLVGWCGEEACGHAIEQAIDGALLGTPEEPLPIPAPSPTNCISCARTEGVRVALAAQPM